MRYKIIIAYDGTDYFGWQIQQSVPSITSILQSSFKRVFGKEIAIVGASRTDTGVHALGQVATFVTDFEIDLERMRYAWNLVLPSSVMIRSIEIVSDNFHPQRNVRSKTYQYHFFLDRPMPMAARYGWYVRHPVDIEKLRAGLQVFVGTHDFRAFCTMDEGDERSTIRTIHSIEVSEPASSTTTSSISSMPAADSQLIPTSAYTITIRGHSFLHYMIRRIVGAAMQVAYRPDLSVADLQKALESKDPRSTFVKAPASGLFLREILYNEICDI